MYIHLLILKVWDTCMTLPCITSWTLSKLTTPLFVRYPYNKQRTTLCYINAPRVTQSKTRHVFVKHGCPRWQQSKKNMASPIFRPCPSPRGTWCEWSVRNPKMNLQSRFGYCIITQTLNIALCKRDGITDRQTDRQTEDPITRCPRRTFHTDTQTDRHTCWTKWSQCNGERPKNIYYSQERTMRAH